MGWNSWNCFNKNISEEQIREIANLMVSTGLKDAGYTYLNVDDCWQTHRESCVIQSDSVKFPSGIKALADYVHSKGLKFGIYSCAGSKTCAGRPGSRGYEYIDAVTYAEWGVDFLKYDWCHNNGANAREAYFTMCDALKSTGRPIVLSICEWGKGIGEMWRVSEDIIATTEGTAYWGGASILKIIDIMAPLWPYAGPGHWNDADMLQVGNGDLTYDENVMHFSMWCMLASPLIVGCDLRNIDKKILDILTNKEAIAINQDKLGKQGRMFERSGRYHETWIKELSDGRIALCFLNKDEKEWSLDYHFWGFDIIGIDRTYDHYIVRDVWKHQDIGDTGDRYSFKVPAHGVVLLCLVPKQ
jgi:alpha-galactosidase